MISIILSSLLLQVEKKLNKIYSFSSMFVETTKTTIFKGKMEITRKGFKIEVFNPDTQKIVGNDTVFIIFPSGEKEKVSGFPSLSEMIFNFRNFYLVKEREEDILLIPPDSSYLIKIRFTKELLPGRIEIDMEDTLIFNLYKITWKER